MSPMTRIKFSPVSTVVASAIIIFALLIFLIWAWFTLAATAATSSNDMGLMLLRVLGAFGACYVLGPLMLLCALFAFRESRKESHKQPRDDTQIARFIVIGLAFVVAAIMFFVFGIFVPKLIMLP